MWSQRGLGSWARILSRFGLQAAFLQKQFNAGEAEFSVAAAGEVDSESTICASDDEHDLLLASDCDEPGSPLLVASDEERPSSSRQSRRSYSTRSSGNTAKFAGREVCLRALRSLLGVGETTLQRMRRGEGVYTNKDRAPLPKHPSFGFTIRGEVATKWMGVVMFMWYVYHSCAEHMPDNFRAATKDGAFRAVAHARSQGDDDASLRAVNSFMRTLSTQSSDIDVHTIGPGTFAGERRCLPYGSRSEMYWEYKAYCSANGDEAASYQTFMRIARCVVGPAQKDGFLKFRKINEHAKCDDCTRLKKALKAKVKDGGNRQEQQRAYMRHILSQWLDRQLYWQFRSLSQSFFRQQDLLGDRTVCRDVVTFLGCCLFIFSIHSRTCQFPSLGRDTIDCSCQDTHIVHRDVCDDHHCRRDGPGQIPLSPCAGTIV